MKFIGVVLFILGFFCRPVLALCFLGGFLFIKRNRFFAGAKKWGKCCWNNSSRSSNSSCCNWFSCDETKEPTTTVSTSTTTSEEKVNTENDIKVNDNDFISDDEDEKVEEKKEVTTSGNPINWQSVLKQLQEMGFSNVKQNIQLLTKHNGHIDNVVAELVQLAQ